MYSSKMKKRSAGSGDVEYEPPKKKAENGSDGKNTGRDSAGKTNNGSAGKAGNGSNGKPQKKAQPSKTNTDSDGNKSAERDTIGNNSTGRDTVGKGSDGQNVGRGSAGKDNGSDGNKAGKDNGSDGKNTGRDTVGKDNGRDSDGKPQDDSTGQKAGNGSGDGSDCSDWEKKFKQMEAKFKQMEVKCNKMETERDLIEEERDQWKSEYEKLKAEYGAYESDIKPWSDEQLEQMIGKFDFDPSKQLSKADLNEQLKEFERIVNEAKESEDDETSHLFNAFGHLKFAHQRNYFFYLIEAKKNSDHLMDTANKNVNNVAPLEWIRVILAICKLASVLIGENGCFGSATNGGKSGGRAQVTVISRDGKLYKPLAARIVCGLVYGFSTLKGRNASHRCGNATCLLCLYPESWTKNIDRDLCHTGERSECCHDYAPCRQSLKFGSAGNVGTVVGALNAVLISELDNFEQTGKTVVIFEDRRYRGKSSHSYMWYCKTKSNSSTCSGKIRIRDGYLTVICAHGSDCPTLTQRQEILATPDSTKTVVQLSAENYREELWKSKMMTRILINGRKFSKKTGDGTKYDKWGCTNSSCNAYFERRLDTRDLFGRAIFNEGKTEHSKKCDEKYASDSVNGQ